METVTTKYLEVRAKCPQGKVSARAAEEHFALTVVGGAVSEGGRISNYSVEWMAEPDVFKLRTVVWRGDDSPWAEERLDDPEGTDKWLRDAASNIRKSLEDGYSDVRIVLVTTVDTMEELNETAHAYN